MARIFGMYNKWLLILSTQACCLLACIPVLAEYSSSRSNLETDEYRLRSAMIVGILRYTNWENDFGETLNICLLGSSESFVYIEALQNSRVVPSKVINVSRLVGGESNLSKQCQVLLIGVHPLSSIKLQTASIRQPCLLICDSCLEEKPKVSVILRKENNRIRFDVNLRNAKSHRVKFRASMLELAANVEGLYE